MQQSEAFHRELRAHYAAIIEDTFARARHCLAKAREALHSGDCAEVRKWMWSVRVLRIAAAEWRKRAQSIAPVLICLVAAMTAGCTHQAPVKESPKGAPTLQVPLVLIRAVCDQAHPAQGTGAHWDGRAQLVYDKGGSEVVAVDCSMTAMLDGVTTVYARVLMSDPSAQGLRDYLASRATG